MRNLNSVKAAKLNNYYQFTKILMVMVRIN